MHLSRCCQNKMATQHYILFRNHTSGMALYQGLKEKNIRTVIAPTPRSASTSCGISLMFLAEDQEVIRKYIAEYQMDILDIVHIEQSFDSNRHKFC